MTTSVVLGGGRLLQFASPDFPAPDYSLSSGVAALQVGALAAGPAALSPAAAAPTISSPAPVMVQAPVLEQDVSVARSLFVSVAPISGEAEGQGDGEVAVRAALSARGELPLPALPTPPSGGAVPTVAPSIPSPAPAAGPGTGTASLPVMSPVPSGPMKPKSYRVAAGDTLLGIAYRFGVTPETILWANDLGNGELLQIGQELVILPVSGVMHTVKKGDTLSGIAEAYGADPAKIVEANGLDDANALQEGQRLIVPGGMMRTTEPITGLPAAPSQRELAVAPRYVVKEGDTLLSIADAFGVRASVIQVANNLLDPDKLKVGQELAIPGGTPPSSRPQSAPTPRPVPPTPRPATATSAAQVQAPTATPKPAPTPTPVPVPAPSQPPPSDVGSRIAAIAQQYLGYRYVWGGSSPSGFDCSGFTWYVYKQAGISIPNHDLAGQLNAGPRIPKDQLQPGDLVFFQNTYKPGLSHSGIYLGGGRFINAETESVGVQIRSLSDPYWAARFVGASRPR